MSTISDGRIALALHDGLVCGPDLARSRLQLLRWEEFDEFDESVTVMGCLSDMCKDDM